MPMARPINCIGLVFSRKKTIPVSQAAITLQTETIGNREVALPVLASSRTAKFANPFRLPAPIPKRLGFGILHFCTGNASRSRMVTVVIANSIKST